MQFANLEAQPVIGEDGLALLDADLGAGGGSEPAVGAEQAQGADGRPAAPFESAGG